MSHLFGGHVKVYLMPSMEGLVDYNTGALEK